jgi:hypothetical protein
VRSDKFVSGNYSRNGASLNLPQLVQRVKVLIAIFGDLIFGGKNVGFLKNRVMIQFLQIPFFWRKYFRNLNIGPNFA